MKSLTSSLIDCAGTASAGLGVWETVMQVKVHWIIDGVAELEAESLEAAEAQVDELLRQVAASNPILVETLGARAIQGKAYLPGSEDDIDAQSGDAE